MLKDYFFSFLPSLFRHHLLSAVSTTASMFTVLSIYKALNTTIVPHQLSAILLLCFSFSSFLKFSLDQTAYIPKSELGPENLEKVAV
ncbi:hypothetical protein E1A91_A12G117600v1 [Gossypium mustelinum]|uniref:Uncharacterized protein n=1 Tax=Gossypium mustelinum TaxID=34275 RepID=A0A5D2WTL0_GOSMU|nr:hypothetical protein E1A91_A12G117600v1 [Gossypium mustelinum]